jgi:hypothetical protein
MLRRLIWYKLTDVSEVLTFLMMEAITTSETSVNFHQTTWHNISEDLLPDFVKLLNLSLKYITLCHIKGHEDRTLKAIL